MDLDAARRARRKSIKDDLSEAYDDDEASPPEWVDLLGRQRDEKRSIIESVDTAAEAFASEPDIRRALAERERFVAVTRERITKVNALVQRLNQIAPHPRFSRTVLDAEQTLRPLFRIRRIPRAAAD
jgi:hypothetical protein